MNTSFPEEETMKFIVISDVRASNINSEIKKLMESGAIIHDVVISTGAMGTYTVVKYRFGPDT